MHEAFFVCIPQWPGIGKMWDAKQSNTRKNWTNMWKCFCWPAMHWRGCFLATNLNDSSLLNLVKEFNVFGNCCGPLCCSDICCKEFIKHINDIITNAKASNTAFCFNKLWQTNKELKLQQVIDRVGTECPKLLEKFFRAQANQKRFLHKSKMMKRCLAGQMRPIADFFSVARVMGGTRSTCIWQRLRQNILLNCLPICYPTRLWFLRNHPGQSWLQSQCPSQKETWSVFIWNMECCIILCIVCAGQWAMIEEFCLSAIVDSQIWHTIPPTQSGSSIICRRRCWQQLWQGLHPGSFFFGEWRWGRTWNVAEAS